MVYDFAVSFQAFEQLLHNRLNKGGGEENEQQIPIVIKVLRGGKARVVKGVGRLRRYN